MGLFCFGPEISPSATFQITNFFGLRIGLWLGLGSIRCSIGQGKFGIRVSVKLGLGLYIIRLGLWLGFGLTLPKTSTVTHKIRYLKSRTG